MTKWCKTKSFQLFCVLPLQMKPAARLQEAYKNAVKIGSNFVFPDKIQVKQVGNGLQRGGDFFPVYTLISPDGTVTFCDISKRMHGLFDFHVYKSEIDPRTGLHLFWPTRHCEKIEAVRLGEYISVKFRPLPDMTKLPFDYTESQSQFSFNQPSAFERESVHLIVGLSMYSNYTPLGPANHGHFMPLHLLHDLNSLKNIPLEKYLTVGAKAVWKDNGFRIACDSTPSLLDKINKYVDARIQEENLCDRLWLSTAEAGEKQNNCRLWPWIMTIIVMCLIFLALCTIITIQRKKSSL